ncbi:MAG: hypothetical protein J6T10_00150 [Methanobrevibacter sp.]|nr:hypothetical protein [Methanobrevibacter sp.]
MFYVNVYSHNFDSVVVRAYDDYYAAWHEDETKGKLLFDESYSLEEENKISVFDRITIAVGIVLNKIADLEKTTKSVEFVNIKIEEQNQIIDVPRWRFKYLLKFLYDNIPTGYLDKHLMDIRPTKKQQRIGKENGWNDFEVKHGYGVFQDDEDDFEYIAKIDEMGTFDSDLDAVKQAKRDGYKFLKVTNKDLEDSYGSCIKGNILDTSFNRELLEKRRANN